MCSRAKHCHIVIEPTQSLKLPAHPCWGRVSPVCCKAVGTEDKIYESRSLLLLVLVGSAQSCSLVLNDLSDFVSNELSAFVRASSLASEAHGFLLLDRISSLEVLHHLALEGGQSGDLHHDFTDASDARMQAALAMRLVLLESIGVLLRLGHDVSLVQTDKNSCFLHHLISFKIINTISLKVD